MNFTLLEIWRGMNFYPFGDLEGYELLPFVDLGGGMNFYILYICLSLLYIL